MYNYQTTKLLTNQILLNNKQLNFSYESSIKIDLKSHPNYRFVASILAWSNCAYKTTNAYSQIIFRSLTKTNMNHTYECESI